MQNCTERTLWTKIYRHVKYPKRSICYDRENDNFLAEFRFVNHLRKIP